LSGPAGPEPDCRTGAGLPDRFQLWVESEIYNMSSWLFPFWVSLSFSWFCHYLFEKETQKNDINDKR
jgi:hypothetical protein